MNTSRIGDNTGAEINYASEEVERLSRDYAETSRSVETLLNRYESAPAEIRDDTEKSVVATLIKDMRDADKRIEGLREIEKQPHLRRGQGVDQFFGRLAERLFRRNKKDRPGAADSLNERLTAYDTKKLREEQERRRKEAEEAQRKAREEATRAAELAKQAEETRLAAERARKPETTAAKTAVADLAAEQASAAQIEAAAALDLAEAAYVDTLAKPAEIMRERLDGGVLTTMARENYAEIVDESQLDKAMLWPFISLDAKEKALRAWAKTTGHGKQMAGAAIGNRPKSVVR
jgi:membrane protein involved in colicin uptake